MLWWRWWQAAISRGSRLVVLDFGGRIAGYASYGRNRVPAMPYSGEIFELYLAPEFQGLGMGRRLFEAARRHLSEAQIVELTAAAALENFRSKFNVALGIDGDEDQIGARERPTPRAWTRGWSGSGTRASTPAASSRPALAAATTTGRLITRVSNSAAGVKAARSAKWVP